MSEKSIFVEQPNFEIQEGALVMNKINGTITNLNCFRV